MLDQRGQLLRAALGFAGFRGRPSSSTAPTAHIVITGHDNAKLAYPRSGLDYEKGSGSFQRAYLPGTEAGYAEKGGLVPADLGVLPITIQVVERKGRWRADFHDSV